MKKITLGTWSTVGETLKGRMDLYQLIDLTADLGFDGIDITEDYLLNSAYTSVHDLNQIRKYSHKRGLPITGTWYYLDLIAGIQTSSFDEIINQVSDLLARNNLLEAPFLCIPLGEASPGMSLSEAHQINMELFTRLIEVAREYGVRIVIETARSSGVITTPEYTLKLVKEINSRYLGVAPDFEAWRHATDDLPLVHMESPGKLAAGPTSLDVFKECMAYTPYFHAKIIGLDEHGEEPHIPIPEMMKIIKEEPSDQILSVEYEGWIPDLKPDVDAIESLIRIKKLFEKYL